MLKLHYGCSLITIIILFVLVFLLNGSKCENINVCQLVLIGLVGAIAGYLGQMWKDNQYKII